MPVPIICWIGLAPMYSRLCCVALPIGPATAIRPNCLPISPLACNKGLVATERPNVYGFTPPPVATWVVKSIALYNGLFGSFSGVKTPWRCKKPVTGRDLRGISASLVEKYWYKL